MQFCGVGSAKGNDKVSVPFGRYPIHSTQTFPFRTELLTTFPKYRKLNRPSQLYQTYSTHQKCGAIG